VYMQKPAPGTCHYIVQWHVDLIVDWGTVVGDVSSGNLANV